MNIEYTLTNDDFLTYQLYASSKSVSQQKKRRNNKILYSIIYVLFGLYLSFRDNNHLGIIIFGVLAVLWYILFPQYSRRKYEKYFQKHVEENYNNRTHKPITIAIEDDYILSKDFVSESKISGSEVVSLIEISNHYFIKLATDSSLIVPKHAIDNQTSFKDEVTALGATYINELDWVWK